MRVYSKEQFLESDSFPFGAIRYATRPDRPLTPHSHDFVELVYVADGHGEHLYKGSAYPISKGDIFVIPPYAEHDYRVIGCEPLDVYNVMFMPSFLVNELQTLSSATPFVNFYYIEPFMRQNADFQSHLKLSPREGQEVKSRLDRIVAEAEGKALGYRLSIKALLIELFVWLSRRYEERLSEPLFPSSESDAIVRLCEFLEQHYAEQLSLEQVCRMCGMSQSSFSARFKRHAGKPFTEYRSELRIHASLKLLRDTELKITAVADQVGICDISRFNKLFKHYIGVTPRQYRRTYRPT